METTMKKTSASLIFLTSLFFTNTATFAGGIEISGKSTVAGPLLTDVMNSLVPSFGIMSGCRERIESINRQVLELPENPETKDGVLISGTIKEQWDVTACGKVKPIYVTINPRPDGKANFDISGVKK